MADLKSELESKVLGRAAKRRSPARMTSSPFYVRQLVDKLGHAEAAKAIGYTASGLHSCIGKDTISTVAEVAAMGVLAKLRGAEEPPARDATYLVRVPMGKAAAFKVMSEALGLKVKDMAVLVEGLE